jgi:hypothetical protein
MMPSSMQSLFDHRRTAAAEKEAEEEAEEE